MANVVVILLLLSILSVFVLLSLSSSTPLQIQNASGQTVSDGLSQRTFRGVAVGVFAHPSVIFLKDGSRVSGGADEPPQKIAISLSAYNFTSNQAYSRVTYEVTLTDKSPDHPILQERFYAPSSSNTLTLLLIPDDTLDNNEKSAKITGAVRNSTLNAFVPKNTNTTDSTAIIEIKSSIMNHPGYYMVSAMLVSMDGKPYMENDNGTASADVTTNTNNKKQNLPYSTTSIVVSDTKSLMLPYHNQIYNVTAISYGMLISTVDFDNDTSTLKWSIPFDFNAAEAQIEKQKDDVDNNNNNNNFLPFIHQEVFIPKPFPYLNTIVPRVTDSSVLVVNGHTMSERNMVIDPDTSEKYYIIHVLIPSNTILSLAQASKAEGAAPTVEEEATTTMTFTIPLNAISLPTSTDISANYGHMHIRVHWSPSQLGANTNSTASLEFFQAGRIQRLSDDVRYNIKVIDRVGDIIYKRENLTAVGGMDQQSIIFPKNETYRLEIEVTGILHDGSTFDNRSSGVAEGIVVVPEFPLGEAFLPIVVVFGVMIVVSRRWPINRNTNNSRSV
jgi:hypothetical protein